MKKLAKTQELITPPIKITPPRTHLNKHPRPKHLFNTSVSRLVLLGIAAILAIASCGEAATSTPLTSLTYPATPLNAEAGVQISDITPTLTPDGASGIYTVSPPLPEGLILHETSGVISGTPTVLHDSTVHTVTAKGNEAYSGTVTADITVEVFSGIEAAEIPRRADTDVRDSYVLFSISAGQLKTDYHLAVKEASEPAPTAEEMSSGALKRNIGTDAINVLIAQRLNAPMIAFARAYFADNSQADLGTDMTSIYSNHKDDHTNMRYIFDDTAAGTEAWVAESVLKESTQYVLYGMDNGGAQVARLLTMTTDSILSSPTAPEDTLTLFDTTLEAGYIEIAVNANEYYIFPHQSELNPSPARSEVVFEFSSNREVGTATIFLAASKSMFGLPDFGVSGFLYLFKTIGSELFETMTKGGYVLVNPGVNAGGGGSDPAILQFNVQVKDQRGDLFDGDLYYSTLRRQL